MVHGKSIRIYLEEGTNNGLVISEIVNWTGEVTSFPRSKLKQFIQVGNEKPGIYFLINKETQEVYIGESDNVAKRLSQHEKDTLKGFWETTCVVTSKDQNLTKSHIRYLESRLIGLVQDSELYTSKNGNSGSQTIMNLPKADISDMEFFLAQMQIVLPVLGLVFLETGRVSHDELLRKQQTEHGNSGVKIAKFILKQKDIVAYAQEINGDFIVMKGSKVASSLSLAAKKHNYIINLRPKLFEKNIIDTQTFEFVQDYKFNSPSAAAAIVAGRGANGRLMWKLQENEHITYGQWQEEQLPNFM
ncbi:MAG: GIY-YIG nuclease family protein [Neisseriaceae bacterium]|nr:GIY-YIG nuclease family protein [Neisseriaceae bacterium]